MKVVLFCGGLGLRMRESESSVPKPMMPIGHRPVLWHVMRYYSHFGHNEFILCLGHGAKSVKEYFLNYDETASNDFVLSKGGEQIELLDTDISDWRITFVDTGIETPIGERLRRVRHYLDDDRIFLANYGDVLTDAPLDDMVKQLRDSNDVATMLAIKPRESFHVVTLTGSRVEGFVPVADMNIRINGGYFVLRSEIFEYLHEDEDLVSDACAAAAAAGRVQAYPYDGFWAPMDTLKERSALERMYHSGKCPWMLWRDRPYTNGSTPLLEVPSLEVSP
ncbi:MAG: sugar phosphate nucleotidyltransferase [Acidimicrobiales bacterium]